MASPPKKTTQAQGEQAPRVPGAPLIPGPYHPPSLPHSQASSVPLTNLRSPPILVQFALPVSGPS